MTGIPVFSNMSRARLNLYEFRSFSAQQAELALSDQHVTTLRCMLAHETTLLVGLQKTSVLQSVSFTVGPGLLLFDLN